MRSRFDLLWWLKFCSNLSRKRVSDAGEREGSSALGQEVPLLLEGDSGPVTAGLVDESKSGGDALGKVRGVGGEEGADGEEFAV